MQTGTQWTPVLGGLTLDAWPDITKIVWIVRVIHDRCLHHLRSLCRWSVNLSHICCFAHVLFVCAISKLSKLSHDDIDHCTSDNYKLMITLIAHSWWRCCCSCEQMVRSACFSRKLDPAHPYVLIREVCTVTWSFSTFVSWNAPFNLILVLFSSSSKSKSKRAIVIPYIYVFYADYLVR